MPTDRKCAHNYTEDLFIFLIAFEETQGCTAEIQTAEICIAAGGRANNLFTLQPSVQIKNVNTIKSP
jgi:hypothetical protein